MTKTHSRPHVSNDNPFSASQFKTLKYRPDFSERFGSLVHARSFCGDFLPWYNYEHHHSGLAWLTPADVHHGCVDARIESRAPSSTTPRSLGIPNASCAADRSPLDHPPTPGSTRLPEPKRI